MKKVNISNEEKATIIELFKSGIRASVIARKLNRSEAALSVILAPYRGKRMSEDKNDDGGFFCVEKFENWII